MGVTFHLFRTHSGFHAYAECSSSVADACGASLAENRVALLRLLSSSSFVCASEVRATFLQDGWVRVDFEDYQSKTVDVRLAAEDVLSYVVKFFGLKELKLTLTEKAGVGAKIQTLRGKLRELAPIGETRDPPSRALDIGRFEDLLSVYSTSFRCRQTIRAEQHARKSQNNKCNRLICDIPR
jgi:hypothetical protein